MTKNDLITEIVRINPTVNLAFLMEFATDQLSEYLDRLSGLSMHQPSHGDVNYSCSTVRHAEAITAGAA